MQQPTNEVAQDILARSAPSYAALFRRRVSMTPHGFAYTIPIGDDYHEVTWSEAKDLVDAVAAGLLSLGLQPEERVAIACATRFEWVLADLGVASAGGATTTIYPNTHSEEFAYILKDSESAFLIVENLAQMRKVVNHPELLEQVKMIIVIDSEGLDHNDRVITWETLLEAGRAHLAENPSCVDEAVANVGPHTLATLIYTSGTTGKPKGVELLNQAWTYEAEAALSMGLADESDVLYLWLPLAHVFGRDLLSIQIAHGLKAVVDGRVDRILDGLAATNPTVLVGVPRIFEKVRAAVMTMYPSNGVKGRLSRWAFGLGKRAQELKAQGKNPSPFMKARLSLADRLVYSKLREKLGGRMRYMISGSAKLSPQVQSWFQRASITIFEGYGATETAAISFVNHPDRVKIGTVGQVLPGIEAKIAEDGELLIRGPIVARGYHNMPEETEKYFVDGWFHTGDIGKMDDEGYLTITDRKKDLFKTSNGKYVAPQKVENAIMANIPYVSQAVVIGEGRNYVTALVALDPDGLRTWARRRNKADLSYAELSQLPEIRQSIDKLMRKTNIGLERWEQIKRYHILDAELSLKEGTVTPSLKIRRHEVAKVYDEVIEAMYSDDSRSDLTSE